MALLNKDNILQQITTLAAQGHLKESELLAAYQKGTGKLRQKPCQKSSAALVLYYLGAGIVLMGIVVLLQQNWALLNAVTKILVTLGSGVAAYCVALLFGRDNRVAAISVAFFLIAALALPLGLYVLFDMVGYDISSNGWQSFIFGLLFLIYFLTFGIFGKNILLLCSVIFATGFFYHINCFLLDKSLYFDKTHAFEYLTLFVGCSYLLLGHYFSQGKHKPLLGFFYGFGSLFFLGAIFFLGGWSPRQNGFWELIFPIVILTMLFTNMYLRSKAILVFSVFFLMAYLVKITTEYFVNSLGWPLALVISGLLLIATGYLFFALRKNMV